MNLTQSSRNKEREYGCLRTKSYYRIEKDYIQFLDSTIKDMTKGEKNGMLSI
jgi:hypothetical protein